MWWVVLLMIGWGIKKVFFIALHQHLETKIIDMDQLLDLQESLMKVNRYSLRNWTKVYWNHWEFPVSSIGVWIRLLKSSLNLAAIPSPRPIAKLQSTSKDIIHTDLIHQNIISCSHLCFKFLYFNFTHLNVMKLKPKIYRAKGLWEKKTAHYCL